MKICKSDHQQRMVKDKLVENVAWHPAQGIGFRHLAGAVPRGAACRQCSHQVWHMHCLRRGR